MPNDWEIGKEAKELDQKSISERVKIEKRSIKRIIVALCVYGITITLFYFFL
ncbi:MAG: hypothetical protein ACFFHD_08950 [Promethearchaeota archaeon]